MTSHHRAPRLTVSASLGLVALVAAWLAMLQRPALIAASLGFTATVWLLLAATIASRWGRNRTFWTGFATLEWGYAALAFTPGAWIEVRPYLITSRLIAGLEPDLFIPLENRFHEPGVRRLPADVEYPQRSPLTPEWARFTTESQESFQRVGHSIAAILLGVMGGFSAISLTWLGRRRSGSGDVP